MSTFFNMTRDINGYNGFGLDFSDDNHQMILESNVEQNFTVPENYKNWVIIFSYNPGASVWVARNETAEIPIGNIAPTLSQLNPSARRVSGGDIISLITADSSTDQVGVSLYALY